MEHIITRYGAKSDGSVCTEAIQRAIDACGKGDVVVIPDGEFVSGALFLKSDMTLRLENGAVLTGSGSTADYPVIGYPFEGMDAVCYASLINTDGAPHKNIRIEGAGVIDANGKALFDDELKDSRIKRGRAVCIRNTKALSISGVTIRQSPSWCLHLIYCSGVCIRDINIQSKYDENGIPYGMYNCDGIDIDSCTDVTVSDSVISSQDDCIAVKSGRDVYGRRAGVPSERVCISNCRFTSGFGVAVGSEMSGGVKDVTVTGCDFRDTKSFATIKTVRGRGGYIRGIVFRNCTHKNTDSEYGDTKWFRGALNIDGFYGCDEFDADAAVPKDDGTPEVSDIIFENIVSETVSGRGVYICGLPESEFCGITLSGLNIKGVGDAFIKNAECRLTDADI